MHPGGTTLTTIEYVTMAVVGILVLVMFRVGVTYIKRELERYEDEYDAAEEAEIADDDKDENPFSTVHTKVTL